MTATACLGMCLMFSGCSPEAKERRYLENGKQSDGEEGQRSRRHQTFGRLSGLPDSQYKPYHAAFLSLRGRHDQAIAEFKRLSSEFPDDRKIRSYQAPRQDASGATGVDTDGTHPVKTCG